MADLALVDETTSVTKPAGEQLPHQPALDGLRGLAVAGVLLFHGGYLRGGYLGVDAFFVLSGFLITSLLLQEANRGHGIGLRAFWARRARRLLPALAAVILVIAMYAAFIAQPVELAEIRADGFATIFYVANWRAVWQQSDYFTLFQSPSPFQHTWSLAIEEQFYLVWPLVVLGLTRAGTPARNMRRVLWFAIGTAVVSFAVMQVLYRHADPSRVYYGTDTRAASVAIGAALAAFSMRRGPVRSARARRLLEGAGIVAAAGLAVAWVRVDGEATVLYRGGLFVSAVAVAVVIAAATHPEAGPLRRVLSWRPLCELGLISYGAYLWHWPLYVYLNEQRTGLDGASVLALRLAVTLAVAYASYVVLERPVRRGTPGPQLLRRVAPAIALLVMFTLFAATRGSEPTPTFLPVPAPGDTAWKDTLRKFRSQAAEDASLPRVMVLGDSIALALGGAHPVSNGTEVAGASFGLLGCSIVEGSWMSGGFERPQNVKCGAREQLFREAVDAYRPETVYLMLGPWELFDRKVGGRIVRVGTPALREMVFDALDRQRVALTAHGARLVLVETPCYHSRFSTFLGSPAIWADRERIDWINGVWHEYAAAHADDVSVVKLEGVSCGEPGAAARRSDGIHFTRQGAVFVWQQLADDAMRPR